MGVAEERIVIVGAGHAGGSVAAFLRQYGWQGRIALVGEESAAPYQRPPLSKAWLKGECTADALALKPTSFYSSSAIDLRLATRVERIDRASRIVILANGEQLPYDRLILAMGSRLRQLQLPGMDLAPILELRALADAERIRAELLPGRRLTIVGGGYIGLEVAASARILGAEVTVFEREARLLARVASAPLAAFYAHYHRNRGVDIVLDAHIEALEGEAGCCRAIRLTDGRLIACDAVVVGVGAHANDDLAKTAGLICNDGVVVDLAARTDDAAIYAIGDCTSRPLPNYGRMARLESVPNALEQARQAASDICGRPPPAPEVPWFWSDQYDVKLQIAGLPYDVASLVVRGDPARARFAVFHLNADGCIQAVEAVNAASEYMAGRAMIATRKKVDPGRLADRAIAMKELMY